MSEPMKRRRKRGDVLPTEVMAQPAQDSFAEAVQRTLPTDCVYSAVSSRTCERGTNGCTVKHGLVVSATSTPSPDLQALLATMLDDRFTSLRDHIDQKLDAISSFLSAEVERLSMRSVETGVSPVEEPPLSPGMWTPAELAELWWEYGGHTWATPHEDLSLHSVAQSVEALAKTSARDPLAVLKALFKNYWTTKRVGETVSPVDLQLHLHDYIGAALVQVVPT